MLRRTGKRAAAVTQANQRRTAATIISQFAHCRSFADPASLCYPFVPISSGASASGQASRRVRICRRTRPTFESVENAGQDWESGKVYKGRVTVTTESGINTCA